MGKSVIVKKSPIVIVKNFILLQGVAVVTFFDDNRLTHARSAYLLDDSNPTTLNFKGKPP